jgi:hypothetical protein
VQRRRGSDDDPASGPDPIAESGVDQFAPRGEPTHGVHLGTNAGASASGQSRRTRVGRSAIGPRLTMRSRRKTCRMGRGRKAAERLAGRIDRTTRGNRW